MIERRPLMRASFFFGFMAASFFIFPIEKVRKMG
nr:MAG TPA: hypothetical protein [Caudoviricetes sp.]